jgi:hypothetical protein
VEKPIVDIDRILDAVGLDIPPDFNRRGLKRSLDFAVGQYWAAVERRSDKPRRDLIKYYRQVESQPVTSRTGYVIGHASRTPGVGSN